MMQIVSFGVAALYSGMWCLRWARAGCWEGAWRQLGLFSGMVCVGSVVGAVAWALFVQRHVFLYEAHISVGAIYYTLYASSFRFAAVFKFLIGVEFFCLIICKLMLLGRLVTSATQSSQADVTDMSGVRRRWLSAWALPNVYRVMAAAVVVGSVVGMVASGVAGAYNAQTAGLYDQAAVACDAAGNNTNSSLTLINDDINSIRTKAGTAVSVQSSSEALTLLLVSIVFFVIVSWSVALFRLMERVAARALLSVNSRGSMPAPEANSAKIVADTMQFAADQRQRLTVACVIVLITFPARAAFDLLHAYAIFNDPFNPACGQCDPCQSTPILINTWLHYTPEFRSIAVAASSPLPLTLSLWLLTKAHTRARLIAADVERACVGDKVDGV